MELSQYFYAKKDAECVPNTEVMLYLNFWIVLNTLCVNDYLYAISEQDACRNKDCFGRETFLCDFSERYCFVNKNITVIQL